MIRFAPEPGSPVALNNFLHHLLRADWTATTGPMWFSPDLPRADLKDVVFLQNARKFLFALQEAGGTATTATGNLNRAFVARMFEELILPEPFREITRKHSRVLNETDVWTLHIVRIVSECAGLVSRRQKRFRVTKAGRELLSDAQTGALYRKLFLAYFRKFDLHYDFFLRNVPGIQDTMAVILWRLNDVAREWRSVRGLAEQILLPGVFHQLQAARYSSDREEWILGGYVLEPLIDLGLLERDPPTHWPFREEDSVRISALWRKFIHFADWSEDSFAA